MYKVNSFRLLELFNRIAHGSDENQIKTMAAFRAAMMHDINIDPIQTQKFSVRHDINNYSGYAVVAIGDDFHYHEQIKGGFRHELDAEDFAKQLAEDFGVTYEDRFGPDD